MSKKEEETNILNKLSREVVINSKGYKATKSALEWYEKNQDLDSIDAFEAGFETGWDAAIDKACEWLENELVQCWIEDFLYVQFKHREHQEKGNVLADFRKAMEK